MDTAVRTATDHLAVARRYAADPLDWPVAPRFNRSRRWYHRLAAESGYEVWLLTWLPGQATDLHDHGGSAGAFLVVDGVLTEETLSGDRSDAGGGLTARTLARGDGRRFGPHHIHRVSNRGPAPAVSLHVYSPALRSMTRYQLGDAGLELVGVDQAGDQW